MSDDPRRSRTQAGRPEQPALSEPDIPAELAVLPIFNTVIYPLTVTPLAVGQPSSIRLIDEIDAAQLLICLMAQRGDRQRQAVLTPDAFFAIGTVARVHRLLRLPDGTLRIAVEGLERAELQRITATEPYYRASVRLLDDQPLTDATHALAHDLVGQALELLELLPGTSDELRTQLQGETDPRRLAYTLAASLLYRGGVDERRALLALGSTHERLERLYALIEAERAALLRVRAARQPETLAAGQLDDGPAVTTHADDPAPLQDLAGEQQSRPSSAPAASSAFNSTTSLRDDLPWQRWSDDIVDLDMARKTLDLSIYGQHAAKQALIEYVAARELRRRRLAARTPARAPILCLAGSPAVGKTTLARALAHALGRSFGRISLHAIGSAADLLGQVGGPPGAALRAFQTAQSANPVLLLDDLDSRMLRRDDVLAALLELTDPYTTVLFDRALGTHWDLAPTLIVAATRAAGMLPDELRERVAIVPLHDYDVGAKRAIIEQYLLPAQLAEHALAPSDISLDDQALDMLAQAHFEQPGLVRHERTVAALCRYVAVALLDNPGIVLPYQIGADETRAAIARSER